MIDKPGIYKLSHDEYHADPCIEPSLSRGVIDDLLNKTPAHAFQNHPRLNKDFVNDEDEGKFDIGTACHSLFLEGKDIVSVCDFPSWQSSKAKEAKEAARLAGKVPLLTEQYERTLLMAEAAHKQLAASELGIKDLHAEGDAELSYFWQEENGFWCRVRPDWISHKKLAGDRKIIIGYKTTKASASPACFKAADHAKDIEWAFYRRGVKAIEGGNAPRYIFMVQEAYPPFLCSFISLDPQTQEIAKQKTDYGIFMWSQCRVLDNWPAYPTRIAYVESKPWEVAAWEAKAQELGCE